MKAPSKQSSSESWRKLWHRSCQVDIIWRRIANSCTEVFSDFPSCYTNLRRHSCKSSWSVKCFFFSNSDSTWTHRNFSTGVNVAETWRTKLNIRLMIRNSKARIAYLDFARMQSVIWYLRVNNLFLTSMLIPHSDLTHINTPKLEEQFSRGAGHSWTFYVYFMWLWCSLFITKH